MKIFLTTVSILLALSMQIPHGHAEEETFESSTTEQRMTGPIKINAASLLEAASTACSDGTRVFSLFNSGYGTARIVIEKNGRAIYYDDEFEGIQHVWSIFCSKNAIIFTGVCGAYTSTCLASTYEYPSTTEIKIQKVDNGSGPAGINEDDKRTTIISYGDYRMKEEDTVIRTLSIYKLFKVRDGSEDDPEVYFSPQVTLPHAPNETVDLTAISSCYSKDMENDYTVVSYTDNNGNNHISRLGSYSIEASKSSEYIGALPFAATNSMCFRDATYLFGMEGDSLRAARLSFDTKGKAHLSVIDPAQAPVRAAILPPSKQQ